ncbi:MAG: glycosyl transferase [Chloroflexi bacterium AL-W]|nr:glycosyl transferase [Chloroflexi bacterium AL-N1]NOK65627.1 glycosyl transferase [Chloroflexi bacterium AL-N10]NOK74432.1 glycosyl transferase [Chloroflexi bacterium AL-N5]NOK80660.1 glycosyl transferase [Chloroflexi bacterium AL-W]NOK88690.1 glycosyl transferase [Chloroflexi bacterium AL-N15]
MRRNYRYHTRRSLAGRPLPRSRPTPKMLRTPALTNNGMLMVTRLLLVVIVLGALLSIGSAGSAYGAYAQLASSLTPRLDALANPPDFQTTRILDRNGTQLYEFFGAGKRTRVQLEDVSPVLVDATIAIEDKTFFENTGVDYEGIMRTLVSSIEAGEETGGASTITQQLIKSVVLTEEERAIENRYQRKVMEIILAQELSQIYTKEQTLGLYLNEIYYGNLAYGIEAAADVYFGTTADDLNLAQASLLAGLPQSPSQYNPVNYLEGNVLKGIRVGQDWLTSNEALPEDVVLPKWRQISVLRQMVDEGYTTEAEAYEAITADLAFESQDVPINAPHFVFHVQKLLEALDPNFANLGWTVHTSLDLDMQRMVQQKARERIDELEERNIHNAAVVVMQPNSGQILSMVGSVDYNQIKPSTTPGEEGNVLDGQVNVTTRERQPGSALKPFTYLSAMEQGMTPGTVLWDVPTEFIGGPEPYEPRNYDGKWNGPLRMRTALANSLNIPAVKALKYAGIDNTLNLLHRTGITGLQRGADYYGLALTLGGGEVTPLDLTAAYNTLASEGHYYPPVAILKIVDKDGQVVQEFTPPIRQPATDTQNLSLPNEPGQQVLDPALVGIVTDMMNDDQARQPLWGLNSKLKLSRPAAVKTGTTNDWRDAWALGYTPYVTVGVWTGNNNNEETEKVESLAGGGVIWHNVMEGLFADPDFESILAEPYDGRLPIEFTLPENVQSDTLCRLPGAFNAYSEELFTDAMLAPDTTDTSSVLFGSSSNTRANRTGCNVYQEITVARLGNAPVATDEESDESGGSSGKYCRPVEGVEVPAELLTTVTIWNLPPSDPAERVSYVGINGSAMSASQIPACTTELVASVAPPGSIRMPDLRRYGENQAKEQLQALGFTNFYVDYQNRTRIPDVFDDFVPYSVVSTVPPAGEWVQPNTMIVLGIRADSEPEPQQPPEGPSPEGQPAEGPPPEGQPSGEQLPVEQPPVQQQPGESSSDNDEGDDDDE